MDVTWVAGGAFLGGLLGAFLGAWRRDGAGRANRSSSPTVARSGAEDEWPGYTVVANDPGARSLDLRDPDARRGTTNRAK